MCYLACNRHGDSGMMELPVCRWRGAETVEGFWECFSPKLRHGPNGVKGELCFGCYLVDHEPGQKSEPIKQRPSCVYLKEDSGERRECRGCTGTVQLKIMVCAVHGRCTLAKKIDEGIACCKSCADYRAVACA